MENTPWRIIFIATGASLALLFLVYIIVLPKTPQKEEAVSKIATFKKTHVAGHDKGKKQWEFYAESGWMDKDKQTTYLENVTKGTLYHDGELITKDLAAPRVKAYPASKVVEAYAGGGRQLQAYMAFAPKNNSKKERFAFVTADSLIYNPDAKNTTIKGRIRIKEKEVTLRANQMVIDNDKEVSDLSDKVYVNRRDIALSCLSLHYDSKEGQIDASGDIISRIKSKQRTMLNAEHLKFFVDDKKDVEGNGSIEVIQGKKTAVADSLKYNKASEKIILSSNVKAVILKGRALLKEDTIKKLHAPDATNLLEDKTFIRSDKLEFSTKNGDARAEGNVVVSQSSREAKANFADYSDQKEMIVLSDNVYLKKDKAWISCKKVEVSVRNETFTAYGSIEAEFIIRKR